MGTKNKGDPPDDQQEQTERDYCIELKVPEVVDEHSFIAYSCRDGDESPFDALTLAQQVLLLVVQMRSDLRAVRAQLAPSDRPRIAPLIETCNEAFELCMEATWPENGSIRSFTGND